jgi:CBS domain-containing protein
MRKNESIKHVMSDKVHVVQKGQMVSEVVKIMQSGGIHHLPVMDGQTLVGIVSSTDLMKLSMGTHGFDASSVWLFMDTQYELKDIMTANPKTLNVSETVRHAAESLSGGGYHSLPVIDDARQLVGIVTSTDLIRYLLGQY